MSWAAALLLAASAAQADLRIPVVELRLAGRPEAALQATERAREEQPEAAAEAGLSYLRGRLHEELGGLEGAEEAYGEAFAEASELHPYVRYRLALGQERADHPEVAAGLVASVVTPDAEPDLLERASALFARSIEGGGDCRILRGVLNRPLDGRQRRLLGVVQARCAAREGRRRDAAQLLCSMLQDGHDDDPGWRAAERLAALVEAEPGLREPLLDEGCDAELRIGLAFHQHRQFDLSIPYLERAMVRMGSGRTVADDLELDARYSLARGYFWRRQFEVAATRFAALAPRTRDLEERARVLYQQARSLELAGDWTGADAVYRRTYLTDREGEYAGPAVLSALRLEWRSGKEAPALHLLRVLSGMPNARDYTSRAYLFLAVSDVVRGRRDRAGAWLDQAERLDRDTALEADYWRGRLEELRAGEAERPLLAGGEPAEEAATPARRAVEHYLEVLLRAPYHPLAFDALTRLRRPELATTAAALARRRAESRSTEDLLAAWLVLGDAAGEGRAAGRNLVAHHAAAPATAPFFRLQRVPVERWPLWEADLEDAPDKLLALGLVEDAGPAVRRHFPPDDPDLAFTGSLLLREAGRVREAILLADAFARPAIRRVPEPVLPREVRSLLYPLPWPGRVGDAARRFEIDPHLLMAVMREESHFDPRALSSASARGLTQFVWLTARRVATTVDLEPIRPHDLYDPEVSIPLGAAYLSELQEDFGEALHSAVAAYNAGPAQARLWQSYCYSRELPEYFSKTGFAQTRAYLRKVLSSRAQYAELYPEVGSGSGPSSSTTGGSSRDSRSK
ncbi:MAG: transglycosylase SLT domain-containing protein [Thermoanaerobaculia bacterium]